LTFEVLIHFLFVELGELALTLVLLPDHRILQPMAFQMGLADLGNLLLEYAARDVLCESGKLSGYRHFIFAIA
jgi:hypothetical protein